MLPLLFLGFSGMYLPLGDNLAGFHLVDWDVLAAVQLLKTQQAQPPPPPVLYHAVWFSNVFSVSS